VTILPKKRDIDLLARLIDIRGSADLAGHTDDLFTQIDPQGDDAVVVGPGRIDRLVVSKIRMRRLRDLGLFYVIDTGATMFTFDLADDANDRLEVMRVAVGRISRAQRPDSGKGVEAEAELTRIRRRPGRPGWTRELFQTRYREALGRATPPFTYRAVAMHFDMLDGTRGTDPDYLRKLVRRHGLPPE
jgi:hypothetical protein